MTAPSSTSAGSTAAPDQPSSRERGKARLFGDGAARPASPHPGHIPALDGVRGLAVLLILAFHFGVGVRFFVTDHAVARLTGAGWIGVDLFFVLSGFLITGILFDSRRSQHYFRNFYMRRLLRIFPLYYFALLVAALLSLSFPDLPLHGLTNPIWLVLYLQNFAIAAEGWGAIPEHLSHYWSLAVEEQFYLLWPLLVWRASRARVMALAAAVIVLAPLLRTALVLNDVSPTAVFVLTPTRADALAVGAFLAMAVRGPGGVEAVARLAGIVGALAAIGVLAIVVARGTIGVDDPLMQTLGYSLIAIAFGGLIAAALAWRVVEAAFSAPVLRWFGRYSYGIYVWHYLIYFFFHEVTVIADWVGATRGGPYALYVAVSIALTVGIAVASYHLFEAPFLRLKARFAAPPPATTDTPAAATVWGPGSERDRR